MKWPAGVSGSNNKNLRLAGNLLGVAATIYLGWKIGTDNRWEELSDALTRLHRLSWIWLLPALLLLPVNILCEALKWKQLIRPIETLRLQQAVKAVLAGTAAGFVTPNRTGDIAGRLGFIRQQHRKAVLAAGLVNSLTQNAAIVLAGLPSLTILLLRQGPAAPDVGKYAGWAGIFLLVSMVGLYGLRKVALGTQTPWLAGIRTLNTPVFLGQTAWSALRFVVFMLQLYSLFRLGGVALSPEHALLSLPAAYLAITFTPSVAWSEVMVRSSAVVFFTGIWGYPAIVAGFAASALWLINVAFTAAAGSFFLFAQPGLRFFGRQNIVGS